jgi:calcium-translocating P-type ATPase
VIAAAIADGEIEKDGDGGLALPDGEWTFVGIFGIRDEIRPEAVTAVAEAQKAGVWVVMITGDRKDTAQAIAKEAGIMRNKGDIALTSAELALLPDEELKRKLPEIKVIARALPADKSRLVRIAQELDLVAGMTGDGVNDSPALKKSDVGFAMGSGTEVAKEAADIVILDDNFNSLRKAILYGRTIYHSIRKFIVFQLAINLSAVAISFICPLLGMSPPLSITQILWINLVMDTLAALAFGGEPTRDEYMEEKPKERAEPIISRYMASAIIVSALFTIAASCVFLFAGPVKGLFPGDAAYTGYFTLFVFIAVFNAFNARTEKVNIFESIGKNLGFLKVLGIIAAVQVALVYLGGSVMKCHGLDGVQWLVILVFAALVIPVDLVRKQFLNGRVLKG